MSSALEQARDHAALLDLWQYSQSLPSGLSWGAGNAKPNATPSEAFQRRNLRIEAARALPCGTARSRRDSPRGEFDGHCGARGDINFTRLSNSRAAAVLVLVPTTARTGLVPSDSSRGAQAGAILRIGVAELTELVVDR